MLQSEITINRVRPMESYVIRIYRRHESDPERVVGMVEHPENGAAERFSGMAELVTILLSPSQDATTSAALTLKKSGAVQQPDNQHPEIGPHKMLRFRGQ
ncbi:MAG: hypothetical protein ACYDBW_01225 [Sulfuricaulis sp.]